MSYRRVLAELIGHKRTNPDRSVKVELLARNAKAPMAVLLIPVVFASSAASPTAVLALPVVLLISANAPLAVFWLPVVLNKSAPRQWPCFRLPCWQAASRSRSPC